MNGKMNGKIIRFKYLFIICYISIVISFIDLKKSAIVAFCDTTTITTRVNFDSFSQKHCTRGCYKFAIEKFLRFSPNTTTRKFYFFVGLVVFVLC